MQIKFASNYNNKLSGKIFSTIRILSDQKLVYYRAMFNKEVEVCLRDKVICKANIINHRIIKWNAIPFSLLAVDTGIEDIDDIISLFKSFGLKEISDEVIILTFKKVDEVGSLE